MINQIYNKAGLPIDKLYFQDTLLYSNDVYGIEYDRTIAAPEVTRIGNMTLHAALPVQSKMRRCLLLDDGTVNYYLDANDSTLKDDGVTAAVLDGTDGQVMVEIPSYWRKFEVAGNINRALFSESYFSGSHYAPKMYVSAYKAALKRTGNILSSVVNNTADYRGGNNDATNDANAATLLGKPATDISRDNFRIYAQNRGEDWFDMDYQVRKSVFWLITCEYATRNHQSAIDNTLTAEGYRKGCLGNGPTNVSGGDWSNFNGYYPLYECGLTNSLGNNTGEAPVVLQDFPTAGLTKATQSNSYRGIENFFGDIWEWTNGVNVEVGAVAAEVFIPDNFGLKFSGNLAESNGYINDILFGKDGDILPVNTDGASSTTYFSDYYYQNFASKGTRGLRFGGGSDNGSATGSACASLRNAPVDTISETGSRLCFFAR